MDGQCPEALLENEAKRKRSGRLRGAVSPTVRNLAFAGRTDMAIQKMIPPTMVMTTSIRDVRASGAMAIFLLTLVPSSGLVSRRWACS